MTWRTDVDSAPLGLVVETKIHDEHGERNNQTLKRYQRTPETRSLWFVPDDTMYVDYTPTHWREQALQIGQRGDA